MTTTYDYYYYYTSYYYLLPAPALYTSWYSLVLVLVVHDHEINDHD